MGKSNIVVIEITENNEKAFYRHADRIARHLRKADVEELTALGLDPHKDVLENYHTSKRRWMVIKNEGNLNIPVAIFGVGNVKNQPRVGAPWMVATNGLKGISTYLMKNYKQYIDTMMGMFDFLYNYVDVRNTDSIKWLKHVGFTFNEAEPIGEKQLPFHRFYMGSK